MTALRTILTVDDSATMRTMLECALADAGYRVVQACDGQDGLAQLSGAAPDVIITDINMPELDGYGFIAAVRRDPRHGDTPILVLTTESDDTAKNRARQAGATGWIVKPFDPERLVAAVRRVTGA